MTKIADFQMIGEDTIIDEDTMKKADAKIIGEDTMNRQNVAYPQIIDEDATKKSPLQKVPAATNGHATAGRAGIENRASDTIWRAVDPNVCAKPHFPGMLEAGPAMLYCTENFGFSAKMFHLSGVFEMTELTRHDDDYNFVFKIILLGGTKKRRSDEKVQRKDNGMNGAKGITKLGESKKIEKSSEQGDDD